MKLSIQNVVAFALVFAGALAGCGGGGGGGSSSSEPPKPPSQKVGGFWATSGSFEGGISEGFALVAESGLYYFLSVTDQGFCPELATGKMTANGSSISAPMQIGLLQYLSFIPHEADDCSFPGSTKSATGTLTGTIVQRTSISFSTVAQTGYGVALPATTNSGTFDTFYNEGSSLAAVAGNWTEDNYWILNINSDGVIFGQDNFTGCVLNGRVTLIDQNYNAYALSITYASCDYRAYLNGQTATGLLMLDTSVTPQQILALYKVPLAGGEILLGLGVADRT